MSASSCSVVKDGADARVGAGPEVGVAFVDGAGADVEWGGRMPGIGNSYGGVAATFPPGMIVKPPLVGDVGGCGSCGGGGSPRVSPPEGSTIAFSKKFPFSRPNPSRPPPGCPPPTPRAPPAGTGTNAG